MHAWQEPLGNLSEALRARFAEIGAVWAQDIDAHRDWVIDTYTPLVAARAATDLGCEIERDIPYGPDARQRLDVFVQHATLQGAPADVVLFVHGGAFVRGRKSINGLIYDNVPRWFARHGHVAVNVEYRLAPDAPYPAGAQDIAAALDWTRAHIASYGGHPGRIFIVGHSAGGAHVATYLGDPLLDARRGERVAGAVLISARLAADTLPDNPNAAGVRAYFGDDPSRHAARSPLAHAARIDAPLMIVVAEYENPYLDAYGAAFFERVASARQRERRPGRAPRFMQMPRHNHTSVVAHFDSGETLLGDAMLDFFSACA